MSNLNIPDHAFKQVDGVTYWLDKTGNQIREENVSDIDQIRSEFVYKSMSKFLSNVEMLKEFKKAMWHALDEFLALSASDYGKEYKGTRGGFTLDTYNGEYRIRVCIADTQQCDERIETARNMIKDCLRKWARQGINQNLEAIIEDKYALNDKGCVKVKELLSLRRLKINDSDWKQAMDVMTDSLFTSESKSYMRFYVRNAETGKYEQVKADFSAI